MPLPRGQLSQASGTNLGKKPIPRPVGPSPPRVVNTSGTATITLSLADSYGGVSIYQASGSITTIQLPPSGGPYPIYDGSRNASTLPITVLPPMGLTILGQANYIINDSGASALFNIDLNQVVVD